MALLYRLIVYILLCLLSSSGLHAITASVIIPCYHAHFHYLEKLLDHLSKQTVLPHEVVISLSESHKVAATDIEKLIKTPYPFPVILLPTERQLTSGANRNIASERASGDIFIYQDADDIPHPQRVETISHFLEKYHVPIVLHAWQVDTVDHNITWQQNDKNNLKFYIVRRWAELDNFKTPVTCGNCAIRRETFRTVRWPDRHGGEDTGFNQQVLEIYTLMLIIDTSLLAYGTHYVY